MKPEAAAEVRGEFSPTATSVAGTQICQHLPGLAALAHKYALVRSLSHKDNNHLMSTHHVLTGHLQPGGFFDKVASRDDWPCYSAALSFLRPRGDGLPSGVRNHLIEHDGFNACIVEFGAGRVKGFSFEQIDGRDGAL